MTGTKAEAQSCESHFARQCWPRLRQYSGQEWGEKSTMTITKERSSEQRKLVNKTMTLAAQTVNSTRNGAYGRESHWYHLRPKLSRIRAESLELRKSLNKTMIAAAPTITGTKAEAQSWQYSGQEWREKSTVNITKERSSEQTKLLNKTMVLAPQTINSTRKGA